MVYGIVDSNKPDSLVLVKAESRKIIENRLKLKESERFLGCFTDNEISVLDTARFAALSG